MARRSAASPLAIFLDYILTTDLPSGKAALEASIAAFGARQRVTPAAEMRITHTAKAKAQPPQAPQGFVPPSTALVGSSTPPVAAPPAAPAKRRGRPTSATAATRRRRPATTIDAPAAQAAAAATLAPDGGSPPVEEPDPAAEA